jgi:pimeloyl-ACP methyl ester carboxylesterase
LARRAGGDSEPVWDDLHRFLDALGPDRQLKLSSGGWSLRGDFRRGLGDGARPAVLLLNSTAGDRRAYERLASELARLGISSLRVDLRGHGESINLGRFDPDAPDLALINEAWRDVNSAFAVLRSMPDIDQARLGVVGAGYSGEAMAEAARRAGGYARAYVALSPGSFSETSADSIDASGSNWLLLYSSEERFAPRAVERARVLSRTVEVDIVPGLGHGAELLRLTPATPVRLAHWLAEALGGEP